ncbi:MAG TPA: AAA family ATPase [Methanospirillum sp.]|nr:AAA family ATPase [Methanospirillum sp.]
MAFVHHKGGTGKTTACLQTAGWLCARHKRVLVVDTDPQANATLGLGVHPGTPAKNIYNVYQSAADPESEKTTLSDIIIRTGSGIDLVPAHLDLIGAEPLLYGCLDRYDILTRQVAPLKERYDHILIDTPPFLGQFVLNGLMAADWTCAVFSPDWFAMNGYENIRQIISDIEEILGKKIKLDIAVLNRWDCEETPGSIIDRLINHFRQKLIQEDRTTEDIKTILSEKIQAEFKKTIPVPSSWLIASSHRCGMPLAFTNPKDPAAVAFSFLADCIENGI